HLGTRVVAVPELHLGAVGRVAAGDVQALALDVQRGARLHEGPLLRDGAVAAPDLDLVAVGGAGGVVVQAQAVGVGDRAGTRGAAASPATAAGRAAGGVRRDVVDDHRHTRLGRARRAAAERVREPAAD